MLVFRGPCGGGRSHGMLTASEKYPVIWMCCALKQKKTEKDVPGLACDAIRSSSPRPTRMAVSTAGMVIVAGEASWRHWSLMRF